MHTKLKLNLNQQLVIYIHKHVLMTEQFLSLKCTWITTCENYTMCFTRTLKLNTVKITLQLSLYLCFFPTVDSAWLTSIGNFHCAVWFSNNSAAVGWLDNGEGQESWYTLGLVNKRTDHNINCTTSLTSKHTIIHWLRFLILSGKVQWFVAV